MRHKIVINCLLISVFLGLYGCAKKEPVTEKKHQAFDQGAERTSRKTSRGAKALKTRKSC